MDRLLSRFRFDLLLSKIATTPITGMSPREDIFSNENQSVPFFFSNGPRFQ